MWSISLNRPFGGLPARRFTLFVSAMLMALFATLTVGTTSIQAQTTTDIDAMATWSGDNLQYATVTLEKRNRPRTDNPDYPNLAGTGPTCESTDYLYYSAISESPSTPDVYWLYVICLDENWDGSDKTQPIDATMLNYSLPKDSEDVRGGAFNRVEAINIQVAAEGTDALGRDVDGDDGVISTCKGEGTVGIGWIVCPLTNWLASGMDQLFEVLKGFLTVAPLSTDRSGAHYYMWGVMQNFANILFIIAFLIIIYSQITNFGISNYGLKRLLPRLIIAAVLVNVSYWIAAVAVDISNILGNSLHDLLTGIGDRIPDSAKANTNISPTDVRWKALAGSILSAGGVAFVVGGAVASTIASAGASLWFLLVALMTAMVSVLVAILVMAVRQALITILIIISPLAFVAYLLPSTEKYFDRWKDLFTTMLLVFPIISVVFGGSQLAGLAIIYSADPGSAHYFNMLILGMLVQIAPIIITPLLIKLSGSIVGRIAGIVNDPNKGLIDKTRKFAQSHHDTTKNRQLWDWDAKNGRYKNNNPLAAAGRWNALRETHNAHKLKAWEGGVSAAYEQQPRAHDVYEQTATNEMRKKAGEDDAKAHFAHAIEHNDRAREMFYSQRLNADRATESQKRIDSAYEGLIATSPETIATDSLKAIAKDARQTNTNLQALAYRETNAKDLQRTNFSNELVRDEGLRNFAGYSEIDEHGANLILGQALMKESDEYGKRVEAFSKAQTKVEITNEDKLDFAFGKEPTSDFAKDIKHLAENTEMRAAAVRNIGSSSPVTDIHKLMKNDSFDLTGTAKGADALLRSEFAGSSQRTILISNTNRARIAEGDMPADWRGESFFNEMVRQTIDSGAYGVDDMATKIDRDDIRAAADYIKDLRDSGEDLSKSKNRRQITASARAKLIDDLDALAKNPDFKNKLSKNRRELNLLWESLNPGEHNKF